MAKRYIIIKLLFAFYSAFLIQNSALAQQDTAICYLRDDDGRIREHNVDFITMSLDIKFNTKESKVIGDVKYTFKPIQYSVDTLFLNAPGIDIKQVLLDGKETSFSTDSDGVTIRFLQAIGWSRQYNLEIKYEATPRKGLYFIGWNVDAKNPDNDIYFTRKQIWTQGQGIDNRHWIPCYDEVNDKMLTDVTIAFDKDYTVISNGTLKEQTPNSDGTLTWHYAMNKPMASYLIMIGIDKYAYRDYKSECGVVSRQYYYANRPETAEPTYVYSAEMMDWISNEVGTHFPWLSYANVPVQDFMYGAMENTTATVYGDFLLNDKTIAFDRSYTAINAHELTHQWFGDYITEYSAPNHWLHESFATYYSKQFMRHVMGEDFYQMAKRAEANSGIAANKADRYPIAHTKAGRNRNYPMGSFVIDMIRYVVGDSVFQHCIAGYLADHAYSNVTSNDFMFAFMEHAGINLDWFFNEYVYRSGYPIYNVRYERQTDRVAFFVKQTQKRDELSGLFKMPLVFEVYFKDGSSSSKKVWISQSEDTVYLSNPKGKEIDYTLFDPASNVLKAVDFTKSFAELSAQALKAKNVIDRYDAIATLKDSAADLKRDVLIKVYNHEKLNSMKVEVVSQLVKDKSKAADKFLKSVIMDKDFIVRRSVIENMDSLNTTLFTDAEKLLKDSSLATIEITLRKLYKLNPGKAKTYLELTKNVKGINNGVRIAWLEFSTKEAPAPDHKYEKQLAEYASNRYEFRTRVKAINAIERLNYCDEDVIKNLFNGTLYTNTHLSSASIKALKILTKIPDNLQLAKNMLVAGNWKNWEKKSLEDALKPGKAPSARIGWR